MLNAVGNETECRWRSEKMKALKKSGAGGGASARST